MKGFTGCGGFVINGVFDVNAVAVCPKLFDGVATTAVADVVDGFIVPQPDVIFPLTTVFRLLVPELFTKLGILNPEVVLAVVPNDDNKVACIW